MWCWIKFVTDKSEIMRPLEFFENDETIKLEKNKEYQVCWSKQVSDIPEKLLWKEGKILHVDNIKKERSNKNPIPGYYRAVLLQFAGKFSHIVICANFNFFLYCNLLPVYDYQRLLKNWIRL